MAFIEARLPATIEMEARGGPGFDTTVLRMQSGREKRNQNWSEELGAWDVSYGARTLTAIREVLACFRVMKGKANGFRFKDWMDYKLVRQNIGTTDGSDATWQIYKRYSFGGQNHDRTIRKPVSGTVRLWVDGTERFIGVGGTQFSIDLTTGIITLGSTLAALSAKAIEVECEFDVPVRFDIDRMDWAFILLQQAAAGVDDDGIAGVPAIPIVELVL